MTRRGKTTGFSLIELLLIMGLLAVIGGIAAPSVISVRNSINLRTALNIITDALVTAQIKAQAGEGDSPWGVKIDVPGNRVIIFKGASYAGRDPQTDSVVVLGVTLSSAAPDEFVFAKLTGYSSVNAAVTITDSNGQSRQFSINSFGAIL